MTLAAPHPSRPTGEDPPPPEPLTADEAEEMGQQIQQRAALLAAATCEFLLMLAEFEARGGVGHYVGLKSTAHWLAWSCSMSPGTAREHVRVARILPSMPLTVAEFRRGRLSYSKVRELTRVADRVDEVVLVEMARAMTASQLAATIAGFRAADGSRLGQDARRQARWFVRDDGMVEVRAVLPAELGAEVITALELALDRDGSARPSGTSGEHADASASRNSAADAPAATAVDDPLAERLAEVTTDATLEQRRADALHDLARTYLDATPDDRSGDDRHVVIVQVSAEALAKNVPAGTLARPDEEGDPSAAAATAASEPADPSDVPAGTPPRSGALGAGPLEPATAERLACTGKVSVAITDAGGEILHLGRSRRLASRAQRRALRLRDRTCGFPGCHQTKHLDAHHLTPWSQGGATDLEGLVLLCRRHHVMVHEGGLRVVRTVTPGEGARFRVLDSDGMPVQAAWPAMLEHLVIRRGTALGGGPDAPTSELPSADPDLAHGAGPEVDPDPERIAATTRGEGFSLAACVDVLCENVLRLAA